ncbi:MAG: ABC transporter ATP-binding protein [Bryobacterales bacterium]|nr:ABC transporter ATP-binding protein [Bryobacterales bacterium]
MPGPDSKGAPTVVGTAVFPEERDARPPVLGFRDVSKLYLPGGRSVTALRHVSLDVRSGEFVALVGRSGSGKSTFLNLAGAVDTPTSGHVLLEGRSTEGLKDEELTCLRRERVGFVFQFFHLFPTLSALENVEIPLQLAGRRRTRRRAAEMLALVGIPDLADRLPHQLSGGQLQRVAIARALGSEPALVLADEPMGNLDTHTAEEVMALFRLINLQLGTTIVMATHSLESAAATDRILTLRDGELVSDLPTGAAGGAT